MKIRKVLSGAIIVLLAGGAIGISLGLVAFFLSGGTFETDKSREAAPAPSPISLLNPKLAKAAAASEQAIAQPGFDEAGSLFTLNRQVLERAVLELGARDLRCAQAQEALLGKQFDQLFSTAEPQVESLAQLAESNCFPKQAQSIVHMVQSNPLLSLLQ